MTFNIWTPGGGTPGEGGHQESPGELKVHHPPLEPSALLGTEGRTGPVASSLLPRPATYHRGMAAGWR